MLRPFPARLLMPTLTMQQQSCADLSICLWSSRHRSSRICAEAMMISGRAVRRRKCIHSIVENLLYDSQRPFLTKASTWSLIVLMNELQIWSCFLTLSRSHWHMQMSNGSRRVATGRAMKRVLAERRNYTSWVERKSVSAAVTSSHTEGCSALLIVQHKWHLPLLVCQELADIPGWNVEEMLRFRLGSISSNRPPHWESGHYENVIYFNIIRLLTP